MVCSIYFILFFFFYLIFYKKLETAELSAGIYGFVISAAVFCIYNFEKIKNNNLKLLEIIEIILAVILPVIYLIYF
jgi:hypothetical protein